VIASVRLHGGVTARLHDVSSRLAPRLSPREHAARARSTEILLSGAAATGLLMVLPGLLSSSPLTNAALGAAVGLTATGLVALGVYVGGSYLEPYLSIRRMARSGSDGRPGQEDRAPRDRAPDEARPTVLTPQGWVS
jgi:hypothetical protein